MKTIMQNNFSIIIATFSLIVSIFTLLLNHKMLFQLKFRNSTLLLYLNYSISISPILFSPHHPKQFPKFHQ
jgi:hypothetical protein